VISRFHTGEYQDEYLVTIGAHFYSKVLEVKGETVKIQIWDTAGEEQYHSITSSYFKSAAAALLVYEVSSRTSFEEVKTWLKELKEKGHEGIAITLIANKCDVPDDMRAVSYEEGKQFADANRMQFFECSAKSG
jgi:small GTP-binding protein